MSSYSHHKMSEVRQRKTTEKGPVSSAGGREEAIERSGSFISLLDIARALVFVFLASGALSWVVTGKDFWWGRRPAFTRADVIKAWIVCSMLSVVRQLLIMIEWTCPVYRCRSQEIRRLEP